MPSQGLLDGQSHGIDCATLSPPRVTLHVLASARFGRVGTALRRPGQRAHSAAEVPTPGRGRADQFSGRPLGRPARTGHDGRRKESPWPPLGSRGAGQPPAVTSARVSSAGGLPIRSNRARAYLWQPRLPLSCSAPPRPACWLSFKRSSKAYVKMSTNKRAP